MEQMLCGFKNELLGTNVIYSSDPVTAYLWATLHPLPQRWEMRYLLFSGLGALNGLLELFS